MIEDKDLRGRNGPGFEKRLSQVSTLEEMFLGYVTAGRDQAAQSLARIILEESRTLDESSGSGHSFNGGFKAIDLLEKLPPQNALSSVGLPETRYTLWRCITAEMIRGSAHTPHFAKALLKKKILSERESERLKDALKDVFERCDDTEVRQSLIWALRQTRRNSEPIVVRALLRTIVQKSEDERLIAVVLALNKK